MHTLRAQLSHARAAQYFLVEMSIVDYELKAVGRDYGAKYGALDDDGWVWVPMAAKFLSAVAQAQYQTGEEKEEHVAVVACQHCWAV